MRRFFTTRRIRFIVLLTLCIILFLILQSQQHYIISMVINTQKVVDNDQTKMVPILPSENDILSSVEESLSIYRSIKNEMIELEQKRRILLENTVELENRVLTLQMSAQSKQKSLMRIEATVASYQKTANFFNQTIAHSVVRKSSPFTRLSIAPPSISFTQCTMSSCFDWSACSLNEPFLRVCASNFLHNPLAFQWREVVLKSPHFVSLCENACLKIVFEVEKGCLNNTNPSCLLIGDYGDSPPSILRASLHFNQSASKRRGFDFLLAADGYGLFLPQIFNQAFRPILIGTSVGIDPVAIEELDHHFIEVVHILSGDERVQLQMYYSPSNASLCGRHLSLDWTPCSNTNKVLQNSTFCLLVVTNGKASSVGFQRQLSACLANAAIPVLLTSSDLDEWLPFWEVLGPRWRQAVVILPTPRFPNLLTILLSISLSQVVELRRQGNIIWTKYLQSKESQLATLLLGMSRRLGLQQPPFPQTKAVSAFSPSPSNVSSFSPSLFYSPREEVLAHVDLDDLLGPMGPTREESITSRTSYSIISTTSEAPLVDPFWRHFKTPWDLFLPTEFQFHSVDDADYRPINHSMHMAGVEFSTDLGGMYPYEQFTIVILCYNRSSIAMVTMEGLTNLPYLHSVLVIWNDPTPPPNNLYWPKLHVPIYVIKGIKNSLNNRFLPYDIIKTEALLMLDDDVQLRHDEIILGFRVWRENRDRLVGFPARAHYWSEESQSWIYYTDYTCEYSMVLTGAAFIHKYYLHAYSSEMPAAIRKIVDEEMNCEDIAMNFLVSHVTRKPPIKVTTHWSFMCHRCPTTLFGRANHKEIRSTCLNRFSQIYGYNPLIYTQFRADSVLFKTLVPPNKQKCFKFV